MNISKLPMDLVEDILARVPLKSIRAVRLTCKGWNALFKSRRFTDMHIGKDEAASRELEESRMIVLTDYSVYLTSIVVNENSSIEPQGKLTFLNNSEQVNISQVFHYEGLLLCILKDDDTKVVVWNPYLGHTRWIETRCTYRGLGGWNDYSYAIGYETKNNKSCRSHKILRFIDTYPFFWYEIYDFDSGLWKTIDVTRDWVIEDSHHGVSVKGNTYWMAKKQNSYVNHIICFDFTREEFVRFLGLPLDISDPDYVSLSFVGDEKLAVCLEDEMDTYGYEIWITTKIDEAKNVSWSKFMTLDTKPLLDSFFLDEEKKVAMFFNGSRVYIIGEAGYFRDIDLGIPSDERGWPLVCSYVPSLVQIKQHGGKRKKQSDLETRLYDEKKSRLVELEETAKRREQADYFYSLKRYR